MKVFIRLTVLSILVVIILSAYFEYIVNRPMNVYIQYICGTVVIIGSGLFIYYFVKEIIKLLNP